MTDHFNTLRHQSTNKRSAGAWVGQLLIPLGLAALGVYLGFEIRSTGELLAGLSILAGLLFALLVFVFQLRLQVTNDPRIPRGSHLLRLLDDLFANVAYSVVVGLVASAVCVVAGSVGDPEQGVNRWWTGALVVLTLHFGLNIAMCLKRTRAAYERLTR